MSDINSDDIARILKEETLKYRDELKQQGTVLTVNDTHIAVDAIQRVAHGMTPPISLTPIQRELFERFQRRIEAASNR